MVQIQLHPSFTAPSVPSDTTFKFSLLVKDNKGAISSPSVVNITVKAVNHPPVASITTPDQTVNAGEIVSLDGSASKDPDGGPITYSWIQTGGIPVTLTAAYTSRPSFIAPNVSSDTQLKFSLTVKDSKGTPSIPPIVTITVKAVPVLTTNMTTIGNMTSTDDVSTLNDKGDALYNQEKYEEAITYYDKVLAIDPNYVTALNNKGLALDSLARYEESITYYDKVLALNSTDTDALNNKGLALYNLGKYEEAITYYDKVLAIDPNYDLARENKGVALKKLGDGN